MDRAPDATLLDDVERAASGVSGVLATEKLRARKVGLGYFVDLHVQADPRMTLDDAHELGHDVKRAILRDVPLVLDALIHMEPFDR
jgi:divalent metal cation (Fe/Co/Zn/Cd) transporter